MDEELIAMITPIILALAAYVVKELKGRDSDKHGDAFIDSLEQAGNTLDGVAEVLPKVRPAVEHYKLAVAKMSAIWESPGFTAQDVQFAKLEAAFWKSQIDAAIAEYRKLKG